MNPAEVFARELRSRASSVPHSPPVIPDYELLRCIGRGAYGEVWLARSATGAYRAVKLIYRDSFEHQRPFEREFSGIVRFEPISRSHESQIDILHVGRGEQYFYYVMELADDELSGQEITPQSYRPRTLKSELLRKGRLNFEECVQISLALTTALQHLHENGLVHRDVKPSNIVFVNGVPKLADIGLVTGVDATRSVAGTEGFAPPEGPGTPQADIYSLGKVLYEMCTGKDRQEFPELPTELDQLPEREALLELNAVIAKACRDNPRDRYRSAKAMHGELLLLESGKSLARLRRVERTLVRLKRVVVAAGLAAVATVLAFIWQSHETRQMAQLAKSKQQAARFLDDMLASVAPSVAQGRDTAMLRDILNKAAERVKTELKDYPEAEAELCLRIGSTYRELGNYAQAESMLRESARLSKVHGNGPLTVASLQQLGWTLQAKGDLRGAEAIYRQALTNAQSAFGTQHPRVAELLRDVGRVVMDQGDPGGGEALIRQALHISWLNPGARQEGVPESCDLESSVLDTLAIVRAVRGDFTGAESLLRKALAIRQRLFGPVDTRVAAILSNIARVQLALGKAAGAEATYREALNMERKLYPDPHPAIAQTLADLAHLKEQKGELTEAEQLSRQALTSARTLHGEVHPTVASCLRNLALILWKQGNRTGADELILQELELWRKLGGKTRASVAALEIGARFSAHMGRTEQAEQLWLEYIDGLGTANERPLDALESLLMKPSLKTVVADAEEAPQEWRCTANPKNGWQQLDFDDSSWSVGRAPFGSWDHLARTPWPGESITLRRVFDLQKIPEGQLVLRVDHDDDVVVFLNGVEAAAGDEWSFNAYQCLPCSQAARLTLHPGRNILAVQCTNRSGGTCIDVGLYVTSDLRFGKKRLIEKLTRAIESKPNSAGLRCARAEMLAQESRWREAADDARKAVELDPSNADWRHCLVPLLVQCGDLNAYHQLCRDSLDRFGRTTTPHEAWQIVSDCLLLPGDGLDVRAIERLMDRALSGDPEHLQAGAVFTKGLTEYRLGRFPSAVSWLQKVIRDNPDDPPPYLVLAMAQQQLGKTPEARTNLAKAAELVSGLPSLDGGGVGAGWLDQVYDEALLHEAQRVVSLGSSPMITRPSAEAGSH